MNLPCLILGIWCGSLSGPAYVWDGDTIYAANQPVRLAGIDAEELTEPHGVAAREHLRSLITGTVTCKLTGERSYNRWVGVCTVEEVIQPVWPDKVLVRTYELNAAMVRDGFALDCARYSGGQYRSLEPTGARQRLQQKGYCK